MIRRIATLLGLIGLGALLCLAAVLTSSCATVMPPSAKEFRQASSKAIKIAEASLVEAQAARRETTELREATAANFAVANENFKILAGGVEQATRRAEAAKNLGETIVKRLGPIGRNAATASKEATAGRKAAEMASQKVVEAQKVLGEKIDASASATGVAVADVGRKVDSANATLGVVKTTAEIAASRAGAARDEAVKATAAAELAKAEAMIAGGKAEVAGTKAEAAGSKAEAAGSRVEAAVAKAGADAVTATSEVRKDLANHAVEAERARQAILRLLSSVPPLPATHP